jgi:hypothetical protein
LTEDIAPSSNGIQHAVTALGGTQTGVEAHSVSQPFTVTFTRPKNFKSLGRVNPVTGQLTAVPRNAYTLITRKGVYPLADQSAVTATIRTTIEVPAGSDVYDPESIRAMLSLHIGVLSDVSAGVGDSVISGIL